MNIDLELEMKISRRELLSLLLHEFCLGRKTTEATSNVFDTMGKDVLAAPIVQHCFYRFKNENFELDGLSHAGRPLRVEMGLLKQLIKEDPTLTTRCLAE